ncbi:hypothetical protein [Umezawaea beigongshangensis]|uniref:hypothetical protein n=1 Tax=Umezawaea beigongshangensis TaxID=2780383 RepID=UPI0018F24CDF|nr:hypothetical protein [Umezawaea beigongshangensis]
MPTRFPVPVISLCAVTVSLGLALGVALTSTTEEQDPDDRRSGPGPAGPRPSVTDGGGDPPMEYRLDVTAEPAETSEDPAPPVGSTRATASEVRSAAPDPRPTSTPPGTGSPTRTPAPLLVPPDPRAALTPAPLLTGTGWEIRSG